MSDYFFYHKVILFKGLSRPNLKIITQVSHPLMMLRPHLTLPEHVLFKWMSMVVFTGYAFPFNDIGGVASLFQ